MPVFNTATCKNDTWKSEQCRNCVKSAEKNASHRDALNKDPYYKRTFALGKPSRKMLGSSQLSGRKRVRVSSYLHFSVVVTKTWNDLKPPTTT